ncbi:MAG: hypothetical protein ABIE84_06925 [bacterium]
MSRSPVSPYRRTGGLPPKPPQGSPPPTAQPQPEKGFLKVLPYRGLLALSLKGPIEVHTPQGKYTFTPIMSGQKAILENSQVSTSTVFEPGDRLERRDFKVELHQTAEHGLVLEIMDNRTNRNSASIEVQYEDPTITEISPRALFNKAAPASPRPPIEARVPNPQTAPVEKPRTESSEKLPPNKSKLFVTNSRFTVSDGLKTYTFWVEPEQGPEGTMMLLSSSHQAPVALQIRNGETGAAIFRDSSNSSIKATNNPHIGIFFHLRNESDTPYTLAFTGKVQEITSGTYLQGMEKLPE